MKKLFAILLTLTLAVGMTGVAGAEYALVEDTTDLKIPCEPIELTFACNATIAGTTMGDAIYKYVEELKTWTDGNFVINIFDGGQLGMDMEMISSTQMGMIDLYWGNTANLTNLVSNLAVCDIGGLYASCEATNNVIKNGFLDLIQPYCEAQSFEMVGMYSTMFREFSSNKPVTCLADMKGQKIRTQENKYHQAFWNALGCSAVPLTMSDLYISLQQGMIDACENPWGSIWGNKIYEVQKYFVQTNHIPFIHIWIMNLNHFNSLTEAQHQALAQCMYMIEKYNVENTAIDDQGVMERVTAAGGQITECPQDILDAFPAATAAVVELMKQSVDPAFVDNYLELAAQYAK